MKSLIVYGSEYGTTKRYAVKFAEMTDIPVVSYENTGELTEYDTVIHFGGLYAGGVKGLKHIVRKLRGNTKLVIVTVGLADVSDEGNIHNIRKAFGKQVPEQFLDYSAVFHLRGGIDYSKLSFKHRTMMSLLYSKVKNCQRRKGRQR